ncbi:reverse transcriptase domain-containing protein [uncultured Tateyamaria sp.]|uniref:reverse transcriptase domain-containing protein n=1 Tax=uncultured Tateyamaria sp. TaxID=455651 RepID=UPI002609443B|nr:reverse transcriptase domain-containing protein [uncultured Tateyamaria sp.]
MTFEHLTPSLECLADETVLMQAWKKTSRHIRYHNWFSDTLDLDRRAINLRDFIESISQEIRTGGNLQSNHIRMVPAPKSQNWTIGESGEWNPVGGQSDAAKVRPLAHVALRDQVIATAIMMCLADRSETNQGDPSTLLEDQSLFNTISYGNRLFSNYQGEEAKHRWGSGTLYRGFYEDYQTFLARPEFIAERIHNEKRRTLIVQSDLRQFYDRVSPDLLSKGLDTLRKEGDDGEFFELAKNFLCWNWSPKDRSEVDLYVKQSGLSNFDRTVLPQGLVAAGFFANVALSELDEKLKALVGQKIFPGTILHDVIRYVDDLRFVVSTDSSHPVTEVRDAMLEWFQSCLDHSAPGLSPADEKTQISTFRADERPLVRQSRRMARIQAAISGGFDPIAGGEILDSVLALVRAQERLAGSQAVENYDPFRPIPDVRDATVDRFVAARFRSTFRSLRPQLWMTRDELDEEITSDVGSQFRGVRTREELDDETRAFAMELISKWVCDPSNVRLLRIALDLWPDAEVLKRVLELLRRFTQKGAPRKAPRRVAWFCLSEILRAGAVETGFVQDDEQLPTAVDVEEYRRVLRQEALQILSSDEMRLPWYLKQQAYLLLSTEPSLHGNIPATATNELSHYAKLMRFLTGEAGKWRAEEFATYAVLARRSFPDSQGAIGLIAEQVTPAKLNRIAYLDPNFALELVTATGKTDSLTPRNKADLGLAKYSSSDSDTLASFVLRSSNREHLRTETCLLSFASKFLTEFKGEKDNVVVSPSEVSITLSDDLQEVKSLRINAKDLAGSSLYEPPQWASRDDHWRFSLGFLLRFILTSQPDFTRRSSGTIWREQETTYRAPEAHWHERVYGFYNGHAAFGDDWLPISDWFERFLFGLLWWPGCPKNAEPPVLVDLDSAIEVVISRLQELRDLQGSSAQLLPLRLPSTFRRKGEPLRACVVQLAFPSQDDFPTDESVKSGKVSQEDFSMSSPGHRRRHRRHLSAALAAVRSALALRETHKGMDHRLDWLILPELAVHPRDVRTHLIPFARANKTIILAGLTYEELFAGKPMVNSAIWVLPTKHPTRGLQVLARRQGKYHLAPNERAFEDAGLIQPFRPCQWIIGYDWSNSNVDDPLWLTAAICFDATDLGLAADLKDKTDVFAIPALNRDIKTFDNMALALHYHMHQTVVVANNGRYGGSSAYAPFKEDYRRQVFHVHGQPQASISFFELEDIDGFKKRKSTNVDFKPPPAGMDIT